MPSLPAEDDVVLAVHEHANGYWYMGEGRSIAQGPYRHPQQLLAVATDLLAAYPRWRIEVFDLQGRKIVSYHSGELDPAMLHPLQGRGLSWQSLSLTRGSRH